MEITSMIELSVGEESMIVGATKSGDIVAWKTKEIFKEVERRL